MQRIILLHTYKQEARHWQQQLITSLPCAVTLVLTLNAVAKALEEEAATLVVDLSASAWLGPRMDILWRNLSQLPPVILTAETSEALLPYTMLPLAVRLTWEEARQSLARWARLTLQLHAAKTNIQDPTTHDAAIASHASLLVQNQNDVLNWERWLPWLTEFFDPATHFARETLFLQALIDLAAHAQRERQPLTVIALALDAWEKRLKHWHPRDTVSIRQEVARLMARQTAALTPYLASPEPGLFWLALVGVSQEDSLVIAEHLRRKLPLHVPMAMTASLGVATFPITERHDSGHEVLGAAMEALKEARAKGVNQVRVALTHPVRRKSA